MTTATAKHRTLGSPLENGGYLLTVLDTEGCIWDGIFVAGGEENRIHTQQTHTCLSNVTTSFHLPCTFCRVYLDHAGPPPLWKQHPKLVGRENMAHFNEDEKLPGTIDSPSTSRLTLGDS